MSDRKVQAYQLRAEGKSYRAIGEFFGVSSARARQLVCGGSPEMQAIKREVLALREEGRPGKEFRDRMNERKKQANEICLKMTAGNDEDGG